MAIFSLKGKHAIVTGGGSGIGQAVVKVFSEQGAKVSIIDLNDEQATQTANEVNNAGGNATYYACNVAKQEEVLKVFKSLLPADILVNCAGISNIGRLETTTEADFNKVFDVNVKGTYNCMYAVINSMKEHGGVILNMASVAAHVGIPDRFAYSMTKGAVFTMTMSVAKDYINDKVRCNCISPARVHTPFVDGFLAKNYPGKEKEMFDKLSQTQPIGRMAKPEEVAKLALYLCSDEASFITGCDYPIDGGFINLNN